MLFGTSLREGFVKRVIPLNHLRNARLRRQEGEVSLPVSAKLSARAALATSGALPENVNYAVKTSFLLGFLESVPEVSAKLKEPKSLQTAIPKFEDVVKSAEQAAVLVLVY